MRLVRASFDGILGLEGTLDFSKGPVLIYGRNITGKTNVVNAVRYLLVPKAGRRKEYSEDLRLSQEEILVGAEKGSCELIFAHGGKEYKILLGVRRERDKIKKEVHLLSRSEGSEWKGERIGSEKALNEKLNEISCYPDLIDVLIAPSNVRNFEQAVSGELVSVPEMIQKRIQRINDGSKTYLRNLSCLEVALSTKRDEVRGWESRMRAEFEKLAYPLGIDPKIFDRGSGELVKLREEVKETAKKIPERKERIAKLEERLKAGGLERKLEFIREANRVISEREVAISEKRELEQTRKRREALAPVLQALKRLPPMSRPQDLSAFRVLVKKEDRKQLPGHLIKVLCDMESIKRKLDKARRVCTDHHIPFEQKEIARRISSYKKLLHLLKHPLLKAEGVEAVVFREKGKEKATVSISIEDAVKEPSVFTELEPVPTVYKPKGWVEHKFKEKAKMYEGKVEEKCSELVEAKKTIGIARKKLSYVKKQISKFETDEANIKTRENRFQESVESRIAKLNKACAVLENFGIKIPEVTGINQIENGYKNLESSLQSAGNLLRSEIVNTFEEFPEFAEEFKARAVNEIFNTLEKERKELTERMEKYEALSQWIDKNIETKKRNESILESLRLLGLVWGVAKQIFGRIEESTNLAKIVEQVSEEVERGAAEAHAAVFPSEKNFAFNHIGEGRFIPFWRSTRVTHPAGSEKAVVGVGIMATLARCFDFPLILDEALDRFDVEKVGSFFQYVTGISSRIQVCLVACRSYDIEKNPDLLEILSGWKIYELRAEEGRKVIHPVNVESVMAEMMKGR